MATLEAFDASVRLGSFSRAAEVLHLTPGAVSRQMAALEADLQVALFNRHARGVSPTAAGQRLQGAVQEALSLVLAVTRDLRDGGKAAEEVRISRRGRNALRPNSEAAKARHQPARAKGGAYARCTRISGSWQLPTTDSRSGTPPAPM